MRKVICLLLSCIVIVGVFVGCNSTSDADLPIRSYIFEASEDIVKPAVTLQKDSVFSFTYSVLSSYWPHGTYEINDGYLTLKTDDDQREYIFKIDNETLVFDVKQSSELPSYANIPDGSVFK